MALYQVQERSTELVRVDFGAELEPLQKQDYLSSRWEAGLPNW